MLTEEDVAIIENLTFGSFALSEMGQIQDGDVRDARVVKRCAEARARSRNGDWQHNVDLAVQGLSSDDADEVFYARYHHREADFNTY